MFFLLVFARVSNRNSGETFRRSGKRFPIRGNGRWCNNGFSLERLSCTVFRARVLGRVCGNDIIKTVIKQKGKALSSPNLEIRAGKLAKEAAWSEKSIRRCWRSSCLDLSRQPSQANPCLGCVPVK